MPEVVASLRLASLYGGALQLPIFHDLLPLLWYGMFLCSQSRCKDRERLLFLERSLPSVCVLGGGGGGGGESVCILNIAHQLNICMYW